MKTAMFLIKLVLFLLSCSLAVSNERICQLQNNCADCLAANINCAWCTDEMYYDGYRCRTRSSLQEIGCAEKRIYYNEPKKVNKKNLNLTDYQTDEGSAIQVQPQKVFLKLVKSNTEHVKLTFRPAKNQPLELYVLMDLTWSMRDDKETLVSLGTDLSAALRNLTENYRLGFGSFADKPVMPMIMPQFIDNPCAPEHAECVPTYAFKHHLSLTDNISAFVRVVNASEVTGNLDNLEGGLAALMQVAVCSEQIGWTKDVRKIVILVSDGYLHTAGDGVLAGIARPNQKKCALNKNGDLEGDLLQDYPSLEEIYREIVKRKINIIFAVTSNVVSTYEQYSSLMNGMSNVEILRPDSSNILDLIRNSYESFTKRTLFNDDSPQYIDIEYYTDCGGQYRIPQKTNFCKNIQTGKEIDFYLNITLVEFPAEDITNLTIRIEESALNQFLELEVDIQRPCPCAEKGDEFDDHSRYLCSKNGYLECGTCICDKNWTGPYCGCVVDPNSPENYAMEKFCKQKFEYTSELGPTCSNHGECDCGECICDPGFAGKYCECPVCEADCDLDRADCVCGKCICKYGWSGDRCICKSSHGECLGPSGTICSDHGYCDCGECVCDSPYKGRLCEVAPTLENSLCQFYEPCVICIIEQKLGQTFCENITEICASTFANGHFSYEFVTEPIDADTRCIVRLTNEHDLICDHYFTYQSFSQLNNYLLIQINTCDPVQYSQILGTVVVLTFLIGLIVMCCIWKCIQLQDAREFARFEEDQRNSMLNAANMSPLYKDPVRHYNVPAALNTRTDNPFS